MGLQPDFSQFALLVCWCIKSVQAYNPQKQVMFSSRTFLPRRPNRPRRCTQPDWDAADQQFYFLFFRILWLLSDKRGVETSQNLHQIVEMISRIAGRSTAELEQHSTASHLCLRGKLLNIFWSKGWFVDKQVDILKETLCKCSWPEPRAMRLTNTLSLLFFVGVA